jgi:hypothetical protein
MSSSVVPPGEESDDGGEYVPEKDEHFVQLTKEDAEDGDPWRGVGGRGAKRSASTMDSSVMEQIKATKRARKALEQQKATEDLWASMNGGGKPKGIVDLSKLQKQQKKKKKKKDKKKGKKKVNLSSLLRGVSRSAPAVAVRATSAPEKKHTVSEAALAAARAAKGMEKVVVKEVVKFANHITEITRTVEAGTASEGARKHATNGASAAGSSKESALDKLINGLNGPNKVSTVEKTSYDWDKYKQEKGIEEDVEQYTKNGYLTKQDFLSRVDHRQFEMERAERERERTKRDREAAHAKRGK